MASAPEAAITAVRATTTSGVVTVEAVQGLDRVVADGAPVRIDGSVITLDAGSRRVHLQVPEGMDLVIGTTSGRVSVVGRAGAVAVTTRSGWVAVDDAAEVDVRGRSGRVRLGHCRGTARVVSTSGRVDIERSGGADVTTTSGRIVLGAVSGPARAHCSSGRIRIVMAEAHDVDAETVSGRIDVSLPPGTRARLDTPGAGAVSTSGDDDCVVTARSGSGRIVVSTR
jgi:DUF4097 and DUF4098 domain-containing protein YvlB